ncbi:hypothetical protein ACFRKE_09720, partial [Kitasatospora indigofera]|uniref:hypothetical protein n=1 Tax=Kitasatospora indigofera TaxID=67307 RepID=UPI0036B551B6
MSDFETARAFVPTATAEELDTLASLIRQRHLALRPASATATTATLVRMVRVGDRVRLHKVKPKYLNGMTGLVVETRTTRVDVELDTASTQKLAQTRQTSFDVPAGATSFLLTGVHF